MSGYYRHRNRTERTIAKMSSTTLVSENIKNELATLLCEDASRIKQANAEWTTLMREGVIINLHIGRWRARTRLTWADLGIELAEEDDKELEEIISLGHKNLQPADLLNELNSVESGARKWLEKKSFRTFWGFFVPVTAYSEWKEKNEEFRQRYFAKRDEQVRDYDIIRDTTMIRYEIAARSSYARLKAVSPQSLNRFPNEDSFVRNFVERVSGTIPSREEIADSYYFDFDISYIPLPSLLAQDTLEAEQARLKLETERNQARLEEERLEAEARLLWTEADKKEAMLAEMNLDLIEQTRRQKEEKVDGFMRDIMAQLRGLVYKATTDVLDAVQNKQKLGPRSIVQLKTMIDQVKSLNFYGDEDLDRMLKQVELNLAGEVQERDLGQIENNLRDIGTVVRASLVGLGETPRSRRELGIDNNPTPELVRQSRRNLGLEANIVLPEIGHRQARV